VTDSNKVKVLVINAGSSSIKSCVYELEHGSDNKPYVEPIWKGQVDLKGETGKLTVKVNGEVTSRIEFKNNNLDSGFIRLFQELTTHPASPISAPEEIHAVGHRVVHGGEKYFEATKIDEQLMQDLNNLSDLAPSHMPSNIKGIMLAKEHFPSSVQVAIFDTAFHSTMPDEAIIYATPWEWYQERLIRRYGFHGISHKYCLFQAALLMKKETDEMTMINCHLGSGGSLCAIKTGESIMNTMGFTPLEGLVMGTRSGSIDPGIILHLLEKKAYTSDQLDKILNKESGLKGISGLSGDMVEIQQEAAKNNRRAQLAVEIYVRSVAASIASLMPLLGHIDVLSFAGGIGENSASIRSAVVSRLEFLNVRIDEEKNKLASDDLNISSADSPVQTLVIHTNEELQIARESIQFID
jgi:acetate kinase